MTSAFDYLEPDWIKVRRWVVAGTMVAVMHIGAGAVALQSWPEEELDNEVSGAMVIELAPMPVAPPAELLNLALGAPAEESVATPPVEEVKEQKVEDEIHPVEEAPLAPEPEVTLPKVEPKETEEEKKEEKLQEAVQAAAASQAAAPPPLEDVARGERTAAPLQGNSRRPSQAQITWQKALHLHLSKHKRYPNEARSRRVQGVVTVGFKIDRTGKVTATHIVKGSGSQLLDEEALEMLGRASPLPAPPSESPDRALTLSLPIQFNIR